MCFFPASVDEKMDTYLGHMNVDMDGKFSSVRTQETNLGLYEIYCYHLYSTLQKESIWVVLFIFFLGGGGGCSFFFPSCCVWTAYKLSAII